MAAETLREIKPHEGATLAVWLVAGALRLVMSLNPVGTFQADFNGISAHRRLRLTC